MATLHKVQQGDHVFKIANKYGFQDPKTIWEHPKNAPLKQKRKNPHVLNPDDVLYIPDKQERPIGRGTDQSHMFEVTRSPLKLRIRLEGFYEDPLAGAKCRLHVEGRTNLLYTDGDGCLEQAISANAEHAILTFLIEGMGQEPLEVPVEVGHLDPIDLPSGQRARLINLGYYLGPDDAQDDYDLRTAVEEFQCDHDLEVDGQCGPATQTKLLEIHGC
jgi:N-acetylmuramoyl-L-alanine amidase